MEATPRMPRRSVAILLALLGPGLGQLYLGRLGRGFVLLGLGLAFVPVALMAAHAEPSTGALIALLVATVVALTAMLIGLIDAAIPSAKDGLRPPPSNALVVGVLAGLVVLGLVAGVGGALWVRSNLLQAFQVPTRSMEPTIQAGDRVLVNKRTGWGRPLLRGDLIVYRVPSEGGRAYVKRVVALPGDRVSMRGSFVAIDGRPLATILESIEEGVRSGTETYPNGAELRVIGLGGGTETDSTRVPAAHCWVLGDNREGSKDSREHGPVPYEDVVGVVQYRYWPPSRMGVVR